MIRHLFFWESAEQNEQIRRQVQGAPESKESLLFQGKAEARQCLYVDKKGALDWNWGSFRSSTGRWLRAGLCHRLAGSPGRHSGLWFPHRRMQTVMAPASQGRRAIKHSCVCEAGEMVLGTHKHCRSVS